MGTVGSHYRQFIPRNDGRRHLGHGVGILPEDQQTAAGLQQMNRFSENTSGPYRIDHDIAQAAPFFLQYLLYVILRRIQYQISSAFFCPFFSFRSHLTHCQIFYAVQFEYSDESQADGACAVQQHLIIRRGIDFFHAVHDTGQRLRLCSQLRFYRRRHGKQLRFRNHSVLSKSSRQSLPVYFGIRTQIIHPVSAVFTHVAFLNIVHHNRVARFILRNLCSHLIYYAKKFVSHGCPRFRVLCRRNMQDMQITSADSRGRHLNPNICRMNDLWNFPLFKL